MPSEWTFSRRGSTRRLAHVILKPPSSLIEINPNLAAREDWVRRLAEADLQLRARRTVALASMTVLCVLLSLVVLTEDIGLMTNLRPMTPTVYGSPAP